MMLLILSPKACFFSHETRILACLNESAREGELKRRSEEAGVRLHGAHGDLLLFQVRAKTCALHKPRVY